MKIYLGRIHPEPLMSKIVQDDIEAVTSLLQEKENDLELAAKIGHELLERNQRLEVWQSFITTPTAKKIHPFASDDMK